MNYEHYLIKKYGHSYKYLQYSTPECGGGDIDSCLMLTLPMPVLVDLYKEYYHIAPKTFMDCGAGFGYMVRWASLLKLDARGIEICKYPIYLPGGKRSGCRYVQV